MVKQVTMAMLGGGLVLGACVLSPPAEAVSMQQLSLGVTTKGGGMVSFFLGEDGAIWFTSTIPGGGFDNSMKTGNSKNPFDALPTLFIDFCAVFASCDAFVRPSLLAAGCTATGFTCAGIYAKTPGLGTFLTPPTVQTTGPVASTFGDPGGPANLVVTGLDRNFWYTLFDSHDSGRPPGGGARAGVPTASPFRLAAEAGNTTGLGGGTGFVDESSLRMECTRLSQTCVGIWVRFP